MRSLRSAKPYLDRLLDASDVVFVAEHRLYDNELYKLDNMSSNFDTISKASKDLICGKQSNIPGHCGTGLFWKRSLSNMIRVINTNSDRICAIQLSLGRDTLNIIGVYMPQQACHIASFDYELEQLNDIIMACIKG